MLRHILRHKCGNGHSDVVIVQSNSVELWDMGHVLNVSKTQI